MEEIRQYLLSVIAASVISAIALRIVNEKGTQAAVIKLLAGLFLAITVISPLTNVKFTNFSEYINNFEADAADAVLTGKIWAGNEMSAIIKNQAEAYILDKATSMNAELNVDVQIKNSDPPVPESVLLQGKIDPYSKQLMQQIIENDLDIPKENQIWESNQ